MKKIYKTFFLCLLFHVLILGTCFTQTAPAIEWQNTIGGSQPDELFSLQQTSDGGYILGGHSASNISVDKTENNWDTTLGTPDYWIIKTDPLGNMQWQNTIGGMDFDNFRSIQQTADGGYVFGGISASNISGDKTENCIGNAYVDYWIVKTDAMGNIQWQNTIGGSLWDELNSIKQTADGGYILGGFSRSNISGDKTENCIGDYDYWIVKTDVSGNIQWQNTIGGSSDDHLNDIQQTADGGYILGGSSESNISGDKTENSNGLWDYWIIKTDASGNIQWQNTIGGSIYDYLYSIQQTADGGYILGGSSWSSISGDKTENSNGTYDYWMIKTDASGNIQWQNTIGGNSEDLFYSIEQTADGGYFLGGYSVSNISGDKTENCIGSYDYWIVKTDASGNIQWENTIGGNNVDYLYSIQQTADGGYILGGYSNSNISGDKTENCLGWHDYWIIKLAPDTITGIIQHQNQASSIQIFPNPATDYITIQYNFTSLTETTVSVFNVYGQKVKGALAAGGAREMKIDMQSFPAGIYFVKVIAVGKEEVRKVVKY